MVYLNYAATSYPKPKCVTDAFNESINALPSAQFRSAGIFDNGSVFEHCRQSLAGILGVADPERIYFSSGSTESLNAILGGLGISADRILTTATEHNSVLRPLYNLPMIKGDPVIAECDAGGTVSPAEIERQMDLKEDTGKSIGAVVINHCSNVTGAAQDISAISRIVKAHGALLILDCSQSAGCIPICGDDWNVDAIAFTGHKSLFGLQGTGGYYVRRGVELTPLKFGGTGRDSRIISYVNQDYEYEPGTQNAAGIAALGAAADEILRTGVDSIHEKENELGTYLIGELCKLKGIHIYAKDLKERGPVLSINIEGLDPGDAAYILQSSYGIITRAGLQCAPLIHERIGAGEKGTLRISYSQYTTTDDLDRLIEALEDIAGNIM